MKAANSEPNRTWRPRSNVTGAMRRWITVGLASLILGLFSCQHSFGSDLFPPPVDTNKFLESFYLNDQISYQTLKRLWVGTPPSQEDLDFTALLEEFYAFYANPHVAIPGKSGVSRQRAVTGSYTLSSSTPVLPFIGNQTAIIGATPFANDTNLAAVAVRRQRDCSLLETFFEPVNNFLTATSAVELPGMQDYLHQLAGLTTTPNVFPKGCFDSTLGTTAVYTAEPVGVTANNLDLVAFLTNNGALLVQQLNGTTNTTKTVTLASGNVMAFTVADMNGDGLNDIVASNVTDPVTGNASYATFLNNGDGTFHAAGYVDASGTILFTVDDVTGDGKPDIVFDNPQFGASGAIVANFVTTAVGNGDGTFKAPVNSSAGTPGSTLITGDFNGDGRKDLLLGTTILFGAGDGTFQAGPTLPASLQSDFILPISAAVGDVNRDGNLDIVYAGSGFVQVLLGNGKGTFQVGARYASLTPLQQVILTDIDGDGNPDIFVGNGGQGYYIQDSNDNLLPMMQILMGRGDGSFAGAPVYRSNLVSSFATADFNGDGKPDLLTYTGSGIGEAPSSLNMLPNDGSGKFGAAIASAANVHPVLVAAADVNGDGKADAVVAGTGLAATANAGPLLSVLINQGNGKFGGERDYPLPNSAVSLAIGDFNGDGFPDVAVGVASPGSNGATGVYVLFGQAGGTFGAPAKIDASLNPASLAAGDLNGDGRADLVVGDEGVFSAGSSQQVNGALHVYLGNANGTFTAAAPPATTATNYSAVALGDVNGDHKLDLIVGGNVAGSGLGLGTPNLYALPGNGDGTFGNAQITHLAGTDGLGAQSISVGDFDGDGNLDVAVGNPNDYTEVLMGLGDGTFGNQLLALAQQPLAIGAVALKGSGAPDLLIGTGGGLAVFQNVAAKQWNPAAQLTDVNGASFLAGPLAPDSFATAKGTGLATGTLSAVPPYSTNLNGTTVSVLDSSGAPQLAQISYVSSIQVNYILPHTTALGPAAVTITAGDGTVSSAAVTVGAIGPGIFLFGGTDLVAANVLRFRGTVETVEDVYSVSSSGALAPAPIDLSPATDQVYLVLYATGLRGHSSAANSVTVTAGGVSLQVSYAGAQPQYPGLDQIDVLLPPSLAGKGDVTIQVLVDGVAANPGHVTIQ